SRLVAAWHVSCGSCGETTIGRWLVVADDLVRDPHHGIDAWDAHAGSVCAGWLRLSSPKLGRSAGWGRTAEAGRYRPRDFPREFGPHENLAIERGWKGGDCRTAGPRVVAGARLGHPRRTFAGQRDHALPLPCPSVADTSLEGMLAS